MSTTAITVSALLMFGMAVFALIVLILSGKRPARDTWPKYTFTVHGLGEPETYGPFDTMEEVYDKMEALKRKYAQNPDYRFKYGNIMFSGPRMVGLDLIER